MEDNRCEETETATGSASVPVSITIEELVAETQMVEESLPVWLGYPENCGMDGLFDVDEYKALHLNFLECIKHEKQSTEPSGSEFANAVIEDIEFS